MDVSDPGRKRRNREGEDGDEGEGEQLSQELRRLDEVRRDHFLRELRTKRRRIEAKAEVEVKPEPEQRGGVEVNPLQDDQRRDTEIDRRDEIDPPSSRKRGSSDEDESLSDEDDDLIQFELDDDRLELDLELSDDDSHPPPEENIGIDDRIDSPSREEWNETPKLSQISFSRHLQNTLRDTPNDGYVAFVDRYERIARSEKGEQDEGERWGIRLQCVPLEWIAQRWFDLQRAGLAGPLLQALFTSGLKSSFATDFAGAYHELGYDAKRLLHSVWVWFTYRLLQRGDEAPVRIAQVFASEEDLAKARELELERWFYIRCVKTDEPGLRGTIWDMGLVPSDDTDPVGFVIPYDSIRRVTDHNVPGALDIPDRVLRALHFPQVVPRKQDQEEPRIEEQGQQQGGGQGSSNLFNFRGWKDQASAWLRERFEGLQDLFGGGWPGPFTMEPAYAFAGGAPSPRRPPAALQPAHVHAYVGANDPGGGNQRQPVNPMVKGNGTHQPFVGVIDVGQGNCNVLFDRNGKAIVYYDFGYTTSPEENAPSTAPAPSLDDGALIVLSHWDYDHIALARRHPLSYDLYWLAPQQEMGTGEVRESISRIMAAQGKLWLWEDRGGHMTFSWGFIVRATGKLAYRNNSGLVLYTCVREAAGLTRGTANPHVCDTIDGSTAPGDVIDHINELTKAKNKVDGEQMTSVLRQAKAHQRMRDIGCEMYNRDAAKKDIAVAMAIAARLETFGEGRVSNEQVMVAAKAARAVYVANGKPEVAIIAAALAIDRHDAGQRLARATAALAAKYGHKRAKAGNRRPPPGTFRDGVLADVNGVKNAKLTNWTADAALRAAEIAHAVVCHRDLPQPDRWFVRCGKAALVEQHKGVLAGFAAFAAGIVQRSHTPNLTGLVTKVLKEVRKLEMYKKFDEVIAGILENIERQPRLPPRNVVPGKIQDVNQRTHPPYHQDELFIMSTGDALVEHIPTQTWSPPPLVVAMVAPHHGSIRADTTKLTHAQVPWAPRSAAAYVVGSAVPGEGAAKRAAGSTAVANVPLDADHYEARIAAARRAAVAFVERLPGGNTTEACVYAAARYVEATASAAAREALLGADRANSRSRTCTVDQVLSEAKFGDTAANRALAGAALALVRLGVQRKSGWTSGAASTAATAAACTCLAFAYPDVKLTKPGKKAKTKAHERSKLPAAVGPHIASFVGHVKASVDIALATCEHAITGALEAVGRRDEVAALKQDFAVAAFAGVAAYRGAVANENYDFTDELEDDYFDNKPRLAALLAACCAAGASVVSNTVLIEHLARCATAAGIAGDAGIAAAVAAMNARDVPRGAGFIVYPAGYPKNQYKHPSEQAVEIYRAHGYTAELKTINRPPTNPAIGWIQPDHGPGRPLDADTIAGAAAAGIYQFRTRQR